MNEDSLESKAETMDDREGTADRHAFIALGSNVGDRIAYLRRAVDGLQTASNLHVVATSPVYESPAHVRQVGDRHPDFLNAVVEVDTILDPHDLLTVCQRIERGAGRIRSGETRWVPRTLDLDLLIFGHEVIDDAQLTLPHPRLWQRRFVLRPLADLAPDLHIPLPYDATVATLLHDCPDDNVPVRTEHVL